MFDLKKFRPMFDADSGGGGGGAPASTATPPAATSTEPPAAPGTSTTTPPATTPPASGGAPAGGTAAAPEKTFTNAQVEEIVKSRLEQNARSAADKAKQEAEANVAKELKENQKYKELSEIQAPKIVALEGQVTAITEQLTAANEALTNYAKADFDKLPPYIQSLLQGQQPAQVLKYITDNRAVLFPTTPTTTTTTPPPAVPGDPSAKPVDEAKAKAENEADIRSMLG